MAKLKSGMFKFGRRDQYDDFMTDVQKDASLGKKCIGLQAGLMVLFNEISPDKLKELEGLAVGGTWYNDFDLSLAS